jgi:hypothetical protein
MATTGGHVHVGEEPWAALNSFHMQVQVFDELRHNGVAPGPQFTSMAAPASIDRTDAIVLADPCAVTEAGGVGDII